MKTKKVARVGNNAEFYFKIRSIYGNDIHLNNIKFKFLRADIGGGTKLKAININEFEFDNLECRVDG